MSKKLYSTRKWRLRILRRSQDEQRRRARQRSGSRHKGYLSVGRVDRTVSPPTCFSLVHNASEVVEFLNRIERNIPECRLTINFENVTEITPEAILAMTATIKKFKTRTVRGSLPIAPKARAMLQDCGFLEHVAHGLTDLKASNGRIAQFQGKKVDPEQASALISHGTESLTGTPVDSEAAYCVILEAMQNTLDHAHMTPEEGRDPYATETYWAMVYSDVSRGRICFAIVDSGVGIFKSAKVKAWRKADRVLRKTADISILKQMLAGRIQSRTGLPYRGKGLPSMNKLSLAGEIREFSILSNTVYGKVEADDFLALDSHFHGTLLYWEIEK